MKRYYFACPHCGKLEKEIHSQLPALILYKTIIHNDGEIEYLEQSQEAYADITIEHSCGAKIEGVVEEDLVVVVDGDEIVDVGGYFQEDEEALERVAKVNNLKISEVLKT